MISSLVLHLALAAAGPDAAPQDIPALVREGTRLYDQAKFKDAARALRKALAAGDASAETQRLLALADALDRASGHLKNLAFLPEAKEALAAALKQGPDDAQVTKIAERIAELDAAIAEQGSLPGDFLIRETADFRIAHHEPYLGRDVAAAAERDLAFLIAALGYEGCRPPRFGKKLTVSIHRNAREYAEKRGPDGTVFTSMATSPTEIQTFQQVAAGALKHELTHLVAYAYLPSLPVWIQEGLAAGGYRLAPAAVYAAARRLLQMKQLVPFDAFLRFHTLSEASMPVEAFYLEARLGVEFLIFARGGMAKFHESLRRAADAMRKDAQAYARSRRATKLTICPAEWMEEPIRAMLAADYGYPSLAELDADLAAYVDYRSEETSRQERDEARDRPPGWAFKRRLDAEHFVMYTTAPQAVAEPLLKQCERVREAMGAVFWEARLFLPGTVTVNLFDRKREYAEYLKKFGMEVPGGTSYYHHFNLYTGAACVYREDTGKEFLCQSISHEVAHGLARQLTKQFTAPGSWAIEGIAHYVGLSTIAAGKPIVLGDINQTSQSQPLSYLKLVIREGKQTPLRPFVDLSAAGLRTLGHHAQAWGLFHFLEHANQGKYRKGFHAYLAALSRLGGGGADLFEKHVGSIDVLEPEFIAYIRDLRPSARR